MADLKGPHALEAVPRVQSEARAGLHASSAAAALRRARLRHEVLHLPSRWQHRRAA